MATAIPIVMISTIGLMYMFGTDLNVMSIASLIIALGMLVDNAIEVCDNTHNFLHRGYSSYDAVLKGVKQIAFPIFIATLTTVFAFLPMLALPGSSGEYVSSIPIVVSTSLLFSYFLAVSLTAILAYWLMKPGSSISLWSYIQKSWYMLMARLKFKQTTSSTEDAVTFEKSL